MVTASINCYLSIHFSHIGISLNVIDMRMQMEMHIYYLNLV